jgi:hypothetical protein
MNDDAFERKVKRHLDLLAVPDYTAKGDAANFFRINAQKAIPVLERMNPNGNRRVKEALTIAQRAIERGSPQNKRNNSRRTDVF